MSKLVAVMCFITSAFILFTQWNTTTESTDMLILKYACMTIVAIIGVFGSIAIWNQEEEECGGVELLMSLVVMIGVITGMIIYIIQRSGII